jgi:hypothetical protein
MRTTAQPFEIAAVSLAVGDAFGRIRPLASQPQFTLLQYGRGAAARASRAINSNGAPHTFCRTPVSRGTEDAGLIKLVPPLCSHSVLLDSRRQQAYFSPALAVPARSSRCARAQQSGTEGHRLQQSKPRRAVTLALPKTSACRPGERTKPSRRRRGMGSPARRRSALKRTTVLGGPVDAPLRLLHEVTPAGPSVRSTDFC